jgi:hypothetical protein
LNEFAPPGQLKRYVAYLIDVMMSIRLNKAIFALAICVICSPSVTSQGVRYDTDTLDLFAQYPKSDALESTARSHAYQEGLTASLLVLYSTWFLDGDPRVAMQTRINASGEVYMVRSVFDWANQAATNWQLTQESLESLLATIQQLPKSAQSVPLVSVVVVTFQHDGKWQTRLYDRRQPPNELITINKLAHSVIDSRQAQHNTSLDASGGCAPFKLNDSFMVDCRRAAASTQTLGAEF